MSFIMISCHGCHFLLDVVTVKFPHLETCGVRKWGKTKERGGPQAVVASHAR